MASRKRREAAETVARPREGARTRILDTAYELFSREGVRAVGIDRIIAEAGVAKATLYHHFASKEDLVLAFLDLREERWTRAWLQARAEQLAATAGGPALAAFDVLDAWFHHPDFEGCSFINTLLEIREKDRVQWEAVRQLEVIRVLLSTYAEQAEAPNPDELSYQLQILMMGAIVSASRGDHEAARRARALAELLLDNSR